MKTNHTPTPFPLPLRVNGSELTTAIWVEDANGKRVLTVKNCEIDLERAEFIVRACNSHDALVAALEELLEHVEWRRRIAHETTGPNDCTHRARAALALAKGE